MKKFHVVPFALALDAVEQALQGIWTDVDTEEHYKTVPRVTDALAHLATLKQQVAELVAFREAHEWREIETAPTDTIISGDVLLWDGEMVFIGYYADKGWICSFHRNPQVKRPTHWQPLPAPPATQGDA